MISKDILREIFKSQREEILSKNFDIIRREKQKEIKLISGIAIIISGIRRCGKSTLQKQIINNKKSNYFNFEDTRLSGFESEDFNKLLEIFKEENPGLDEFFFDEIQNIPKWEIFIRSLLDRKCKVLITGSNASLLSKELGTRLTGRHINTELFPFSFREFLALEKKEPSLKSFEEYFTKGGFPEYLQIKKSELLQEILLDVIARDIANRHNVKNVNLLKEMAIFLISNVSKEFSYNSLRKILNLGSTNSVIHFVSYFEDSYLLFSVPKFSYSLKKQLVNPKKIYAIDNGLIRFNTKSFSADKGKMLENLVFVELRRHFKEIFYFKNKGECDFVYRDKERKMHTVQVCHHMNQDNQKREINGLLEAMEEFNFSEGLILTYNQEDKFNIKDKKIILKPIWKWLLDKR